MAAIRGGMALGGGLQAMSRDLNDILAQKVVDTEARFVHGMVKGMYDRFCTISFFPLIFTCFSFLLLSRSLCSSVLHLTFCSRLAFLILDML